MIYLTQDTPFAAATIFHLPEEVGLRNWIRGTLPPFWEWEAHVHSTLTTTASGVIDTTIWGDYTYLASVGEPTTDEEKDLFFIYSDDGTELEHLVFMEHKDQVRLHLDFVNNKVTLEGDGSKFGSVHNLRRYITQELLVEMMS